MSPHSFDLTKLEDHARGLLDPDIADFIASGSGDQCAVTANVEAWRRVHLRPRVLRDVGRVSTRASLLGTSFASPVGLAPTAFHRLAHADGELATARAAAKTGTLLVLSTRSSQPLEAVAAIAGPWWFQVYVMRDRGLTSDIVRRAAAAGARALVLTADTPYLAPRRTNRDDLFLTNDLLAANLGPGYSHDGARQAPDITFDDIAWLQAESGLPVVVKGVLRGDDAHTCAEAGAAAIWVSNHGGRQLDGALPTAEALSDVDCGAGVPVYVDGGIRSGTDVLRALALGADGVFLGRPALWSLAAGRLAETLTALKADLSLAMALAGISSLADITPDLARQATRT